MRTHAILLATLLLALLTACQTIRDLGKPDVALVPPAGATAESCAKDMQECLARARELAAAGALTPLAPEDTARLGGRDTAAFLLKGEPQVSGDKSPAAIRTSLVSSNLYGPKEVSDRYVLLLLDRGYRWP
jgi:hypothetical protein